MREYKRLTDEQKIKAVELYGDGNPYKKVAEMFGVTTMSIWRLLKRRGVKSRGAKKYSIDESFFEKIDTADKAYFLGFLYADGYIDEKRGQVELSLQSKDKSILEKLSKCINSNKPLTYKKAKKHWKTGNMGSDSYRLYIKNRKMANDLTKLDMRQKKSFDLRWPKFIREDLIWHFIRGYFDGDGSICIKHNGYGTSYGACSIISSVDFIASLNNFLTKNGFKCSIDNHKSQNYSREMNSIVINRISDIKKFYEKVYFGTTLFLERKKLKFEELIKLKNANQ